MPHLFLHIRHGEDFFPDTKGGYYTHLEDARHEARWAAREMMRLQVHQDQAGNGSEFEITDAAGKVLLVCPFHNATDDENAG